MATRFPRVKPEVVLNNFLRDVENNLAIDLRDALIPKVERHDFLVNATADDETPTVLGLDGDSLTFYRRHEEALSVTTHQAIWGASLTEHQKLVTGGLLTTAYTLEHPYLPRSGQLKINVSDIQGEEEAFLKHLEPFLGPGPSRAP